MAEISKKQSNNFFNANFHHQGGADPKVMGTIESGLSRQLHRHLKIQNPIIFDRLAAVLSLGDGRRRRRRRRRRRTFADV